MESSVALPSLDQPVPIGSHQASLWFIFLSSMILNLVTFSVLWIPPLYGITASGDGRKTSECQSIFSSLLYGKGKGGLCQKEMFMIVLINCSISPRIPWAAGNDLTSAVLFYFLEAIQVLYWKEIPHKYQPTSVRSIAQCVASKHPDKSCGTPFSPLDTACFLGGHDMVSFQLAKKTHASVL